MDQRAEERPADEVREERPVEERPVGCKEPVVGWCRVCDSFHAPVLTPTSSREDLLTWLSWSDKNGVYLDADIEAEGLTPWTREQALAEVYEQGGLPTEPENPPPPKL